jgi:transposase
MEREKRTRRTRRHFTDEFKKATARLVLDEGKTVSAVARDLDLTVSSVDDWVEKMRAEKGISKKGTLKIDEREELAKLRKDVRVLRIERDILKKAAAFFAKENS